MYATSRVQQISAVFYMARQLVLSNKENEPLQRLYENELFRLKDPEALQAQLTMIDQTGPFRRIYVMGCGRSGTWLLTHVLSNDTDVVLRELTVEYFGLLIPDRPVLVLKRDHVAYRGIERIPASIEIAYRRGRQDARSNEHRQHTVRR